MKVVLAALNAKFIHASLSLAYLKAYSQNDLWDIEIREYTINEPIDDILADLYLAKPDVLCFSCYIWNIEPTLRLCHDFKTINPHIPIILGGPEVSYDSVALLDNHPVDFIVAGEGEETFTELLEAIFYKGDLAGLKGISYRDNGQIKTNPDRNLIIDLDVIPFPYQDNLSSYANKTIYYESSRGCPFNCAYCLSSTIKGVRFFSLERVKKDLSYLMDHKVREVKFVDRTFNCNEPRAIEIMQYIIDNNTDTKFHFEIGAELISEEFISFLADMPSNMFDFEIGIQSTFLPALAAVNRKTNWSILEKKVRSLVQLGNIHIHLDLIAGLPYETYADFGQSFNDVYKLNPDMLQLGFLKLLKGSAIRNYAHQYGYIHQNQPPYQVLANNSISYDEIIKLTNIEKLVNRYFNTHIIEETLYFITQEIFSGNAFRFFASFAQYWREQNLFYFGHKRDKEYSIVKQYINHNFPGYALKINETLKYDYCKNNHSYNLPVTIETKSLADINNLLNLLLKDEAFVSHHLNDLKGKTVREIKKYVNLVHFDLNPLDSYSKPGFIMFVYDSSKKAARIIDVTEHIRADLDTDSIASRILSPI